MNGCYADNKVRIDTMRRQLEQYSKVETAVCPPFVYISEVVKLLKASEIHCGSQDVSGHPNGAFTGEISTSMLTDIGCTFAIVGHSERRQYHHETNQQIAKKAVAALKVGLTPIICVGESQQQREAEETLAVAPAREDCCGQKPSSLPFLAHSKIAMFDLTGEVPKRFLKQARNGEAAHAHRIDGEEQEGTVLVEELCTVTN